MADTLRYGAHVADHDISFFAVEATWPCTCNKPGRGCCNKDFARYSSLAFNDRRRPNTDYDAYGDCRGTFDKENRDVSRKKLERDPYSNHLTTSPLFTEAGDAIAYALRLAEFGELASKYSNMTHIPRWRERHEGKIKARVVHERSMKQVDAITVVISAEMIDAD